MIWVVGGGDRGLERSLFFFSHSACFVWTKWKQTSGASSFDYPHPGSAMPSDVSRQLGAHQSSWAMLQLAWVVRSDCRPHLVLDPAILAHDDAESREDASSPNAAAPSRFCSHHARQHVPRLALPCLLSMVIWEMCPERSTFGGALSEPPLHGPNSSVLRTSPWRPVVSWNGSVGMGNRAIVSFVGSANAASISAEGRWDRLESGPFFLASWLSPAVCPPHHPPSCPGCTAGLSACWDAVSRSTRSQWLTTPRPVLSWLHPTMAMYSYEYSRSGCPGVIGHQAPAGPHTLASDLEDGPGVSSAQEGRLEGGFRFTGTLSRSSKSCRSPVRCPRQKKKGDLGRPPG